MFESKPEPRYAVISADCHGGADPGGYRGYLDARFRDDFDEWFKTFKNPYPDLEGAEGSRNWDSARRLRDLEDDGLVGEVLYPNTVPPFFQYSSLGSQMAPTSQHELDLRWAGLQAHNRWLVDFCGEAPGRRAGVIQVTLHDIPGSVREVERAARAGLTGGILLPGAPPGCGLPALYDDEYFGPLWSACQDAGFPVNCHSGGAGPRPDDSPTGHVLFMLELAWWDQRVLRHLVLGGVLERYPRLQFCFTEAGVAWIPRELRALEGFVDAMGRPQGGELSFGEQVAAGLSCRPTEYWRRQCHVGASFLHRSERVLWDDIGVETMMWGSDYPHVEASFPYSRQAIAMTFAGAPAARVERVLGANAAALYRFDLAALAEVAQRVGPSRDAVRAGIAPESVPAGAAKCPAFAGLLSGSARTRWADNRTVGEEHPTDAMTAVTASISAPPGS